MALHVARSRIAACSSTVISQGRTWSAPAARQRTLGTSASHGGLRRRMSSLQRAGCQWDKGHAARMRGVLACRTLLQCRRLRKCAAKDNVFYKNSKTTFTAEMRHQNVTYLYGVRYRLCRGGFFCSGYRSLIGKVLRFFSLSSLGRFLVESNLR